MLTKAMVMEHFDELVTDPAVSLADVEAHLAALKGNERFRGRYWVAATSGTTGRRGIFLWDLDEWVDVLASYNRSLDWAGAAGLTRQVRMAVVSSTTPWHQSARVGATVRSPWVQTLRIDSGDPLEQTLERLDRFQPQVLVAYASMLRLLAFEQAAGHLRIAPDLVFSASEVLTGETRRRIDQAWGKQPLTSTPPPRQQVSPPNASSIRACICSRTWSSPRWWTLITSPCPWGPRRKGPRHRAVRPDPAADPLRDE